MKTTTFYSYKGGLGRSLLLAWVAKRLSSEGEIVIALDFDLEAPGLAYKFGFIEGQDLGQGMVGLLRRFLRNDAPPENLKEWVIPVPDCEGLFLLPAGPLSPREYWGGLGAVSGSSLLASPNFNGARFFAWLKESIDQQFSPAHLLIDARTGVTEMGGAALSLMADQVVALVGTSVEGVVGMREVLRSVMSNAQAFKQDPPRIGIALSRLPPSTDTLELQKLRDSIRDRICEPADPLLATVAAGTPLVIRSEVGLQIDERLALGAHRLRVHEDYGHVLKWVIGKDAPEAVPGVVGKSPIAIRDSIAHQRELAELDPDTYLPDLAASLDGLAASHMGNGDVELAVTAAEGAVEVRRQFAVLNPKANEADLARSLSSLDIALSSLGRLDEAVAAMEKVVEIYRRLVKARPSAYESDLPSALLRLGSGLSLLGRLEESLAVTVEVVEIYRSLAKTRPDAYGADLAMSLNILGYRLSSLGRHEEAIVGTDEAVEIYRSLAKARPDAYGADLARSLNNLGYRLSSLGRDEEALIGTEEAVEIYRPLAKARPDAYGVDFAGALNNLGSRLLSLGRHEEAIVGTEEAVEIYRSLAKARPDAYGVNLAGALNNLGVDLLSVSRYEEAIAATEEAVEIYRPLAEALPDAYGTDLAGALNNLGLELSSLDRHEEAIAATEEAVEIRRPLAKALPDAYGADLARSLGALGGVFKRQSPPKAAGFFQEGLRVLLPHLKRAPAAHSSLANSLRQDAIQACEVAGVPPADRLLLGEVEGILRRLNEGESPTP